jgi:hypothetical protein
MLLRSPSDPWTPADIPLLDELGVLLGRQAPRRGDDGSDVAKEDRWWIERMLTEMAADDPMIDQMRDQLMDRFLDERRASERDRPTCSCVTRSATLWWTRRRICRRCSGG